MGKLVKYPDGRVELDISEENILALAREALLLHASDNASARFLMTHSEEKSNAIPLVDNKIRLKHKFPAEQWELISQTEGERRGPHNHNLFILYQNRETKQLVGIEKSKKKEKPWYFGSPKQEQSQISQITRAVEAMPFQEPFSRRKLGEALPANLARPGVLKFAFEYLKHIGIMKESVAKEMGTGAKQYTRLKEKADSPRQESGQEAAGAILRKVLADR